MDVLAFQANSVTKLNINTDSQFMINCMEQWLEGWKRKGWKTAKGEPGVCVSRDTFIRQP